MRGSCRCSQSSFSLFSVSCLYPGYFAGSNTYNDTVLGLGIWQTRTSNLCPFLEGPGRGYGAFSFYNNCSGTMSEI